MYLVLKFGITDYCVDMHILKINSYSDILLLNFGYNSVININGQMKTGILPICIKPELDWLSVLE